MGDFILQAGALSQKPAFNPGQELLQFFHAAAVSGGLSGNLGSVCAAGSELLQRFCQGGQFILQVGKIQPAGKLLILKACHELANATVGGARACD